MIGNKIIKNNKLLCITQIITYSQTLEFLDELLSLIVYSLIRKHF